MCKIVKHICTLVENNQQWLEFLEHVASGFGALGTVLCAGEQRIFFWLF